MDGMSSSPRRWASEDGVSKIRNFEQRLVELENRLGDVEKRDEGSVRGVQMQIDGLKDALTQQQRARETLEDRKSKEVKLTPPGFRCRTLQKEIHPPPPKPRD
ncbi:hypothetical protein DIPPA_26946 [Diplonema papillatum]|nr:hypothetical protein DIPPA_26946 [Diplonema papillatum]